MTDFERAYARLSVLANDGRNLLTDEDADLIIAELHEKDTTIRDLEDKITDIRARSVDYTGDLRGLIP